jgi:hypothetical protein
MASREDLLQSAINRATIPIYLSTKAQIVDYYKDTYKGRDKRGNERWIGQISRDLSGTSDTKSRAYQSAQRNFQGTRLNREGDTAKWRAFGEKLSPVSRRLDGTNSITIKIKGIQPGSGGEGRRDRKISVTFEGSAAYDFINKPTYKALWDKYKFNFDEEENGDYGLDIYSVSAT